MMFQARSMVELSYALGAERMSDVHRGCPCVEGAIWCLKMNVVI